MLSWCRVEGGVKKTYSWGFSVVYAESFEDCFSSEELLQVREELEKLQEIDLKVKVENRIRKKRNLDALRRHVRGKG